MLHNLNVHHNTISEAKRDLLTYVRLSFGSQVLAKRFIKDNAIEVFYADSSGWTYDRLEVDDLLDSHYGY